MRSHVRVALQQGAVFRRRCGGTDLPQGHSGLVHQQLRFQAATAAASSPDNNTTAAADGPMVPRELNFAEDFLMSEEDYHTIMLEEAHRKHGTHLNVPPQLPPDGEAPEVPEVIMCEALKTKLASMTLAYPPTHAPPPLATCGTRGLEDLMREEEQAAKKRLNGGVISPASSSAPTTTTTATTSAPSAKSAGPKRLPIEHDKKFHCSYCFKPFRAKLAADSHAKLAHKEVGAVEVFNTAGPGEFSDSQQADLFHAANPSALKTVAAKAAAGAPKEKKVYSAAKLALPEDDEIGEMLKSIWDVLGKKLVGETYKDTSTTVEGIADKRPPPGSEKASLSATPAGAAPGIRVLRTATTAGIPLNANGKPMSAQEMSARFESPLGDVDFGDFDPDEDLKNPFLSPEAIQKLQARRSVSVVEALMKQVLLQHERIVILQGGRSAANAKGPGDTSTVVSAVNKVLAANKDHKDIDGEHLVSALKHLHVDANVVETVIADSIAQDRSIGAKPALASSSPAATIAAKKAADSVFGSAFLNVAKAKVLADQQQQEAGSSKGSSALTSSTHSVATSVPKGKMACLECGSTYRLLDALQDHYEEAHGKDLPDELLTKYMNVSPATDLYEGKYTANAGETTAAASASGGGAASAGSSAATGGGGAAGASSGGGDDDDGLKIPTPIEEKDVSLHVRAATNTVISGAIVEVKHGFIQNHAVCQIVVKAIHSADSSTTDDAAAADADIELFTVRCFGDEFQQTGIFGQQLQVGANVVANGQLKLNRHMDTVSNKVHAYPFVSVASPCGFVQLLD